MVLCPTHNVSGTMVTIRTFSRLAALVWLAVSAAAGPAEAQSTARVRAAENVRREPNGEIVARVEAGATMAVVGRRDRWLQVDLEGWMWDRSLQSTNREGFTLMVSEPQGENLRDAPAGAIIGRLGRGALLSEVERRPGWIRVRRRAWIWAPSVVETSTPAAAASASAPARVPAPAPTAAPSRPTAVVAAGGSGAVILTAPSGDTLARTGSGVEMEVLAREGNWARVRVEGWTWLPPREAAAGVRDESPRALTPRDLAADPLGHRGRVVSWELQFISLERAEKVRTDFFEGEPFILARHGGPDGPFVYVAVPAERTAELQGLVPLERLRVTGRVRTGAAALTGTPIIDLVALERLRVRE